MRRIIAVLVVLLVGLGPAVLTFLSGPFLTAIAPRAPSWTAAFEMMER